MTVEIAFHKEKLPLSIHGAPSEGERRAISRELISLMGGVALLLVSFIRGWTMPAEPPYLNEMLRALAALLLALPVFVRALWSLMGDLRGKSSDQLVATAVVAAMASGEFTSAALVLLFLRLGHFCEERSVLGARAAIIGLKRLHTQNATIIVGANEIEIDSNLLQSGQTLKVRPGEMVAADGLVMTGESLIDESLVTGETAAKEISRGCKVYASTLNLSGVLTILVEQVGEGTAIGRIETLLHEAGAAKAPVLIILERYASVFVPLILLIAALVLMVTHDLSRAITVLVVSCPGAFVLAGPVAMVAALAVASKLGILIKNAKFLERMAEIDTILFDKTGTLTSGHLMVTEVVPLVGSKENLIRGALSLAQGSNHPASRAVFAVAHLMGLQADASQPPYRVNEIFGQGVLASDGQQHLRLGKHSWLKESGVTLPSCDNIAASAVWFARDQVAVGYFLLGDHIRDSAQHAIARLKSQGINRAIMVTGDEWEPAREIGARLGLDEVMARVLPEDKLNLVLREKARGRSVMVVGDGVNDALALAAGDVGVAMGHGASDIALHSADLALITNDLGRLPLAIDLSRKTRSIIHQNVTASALTSLVMIALAAFGVVTPVWGAILHNFGEIFVILNSGRLLRFDDKAPARMALTT